MKEKLYVFGFDNTLVNSEDLIVELTAKSLKIKLTKDFWYKNLHSVQDVETEMRILQESFGVEYTKEVQAAVGKEFVESLSQKEPVKEVFNLLKENLSSSRILTGSPLFIVQNYLKAKGIEISESNIFAGVYNGSGEKEKLLEDWQKEFDVTYFDDDATLVKNAEKIVSEAFLVKQAYNKPSWKDFRTIGSLTLDSL